jgi:hypothetical protein
MEREQDPTETPDAVSRLDPDDVPGGDQAEEDEEFVGPPTDEIAPDEDVGDEPGYGA